jgi:monofunctional biosynthetic peptidoglycan transglycosylase
MHDRVTLFEAVYKAMGRSLRIHAHMISRIPRFLSYVFMCLITLGGFVIIGAIFSFAFLLDHYDRVNPVSVPMRLDEFAYKPVRHNWVPLERISPAMVRSVVAAEDDRFCFHRGVDWQELSAVLLDQQGPRRGASTITMQVVRNLFLWPSRSYIRKIIEIPMALLVEMVWTKRRILEIYLNIAEWGDGIYGVDAAANSYFAVSVQHITAAQAVLMAASLPAPLLRNPSKPSFRQLRLAGAIRARIATQKNMSCLFLPKTALRD